MSILLLLSLLSLLSINIFLNLLFLIIFRLYSNMPRTLLTWVITCLNLSPSTNLSFYRSFSFCPGRVWNEGFVMCHVVRMYWYNINHPLLIFVFLHNDTIKKKHLFLGHKRKCFYLHLSCQTWSRKFKYSSIVFKANYKNILLKRISSITLLLYKAQNRWLIGCVVLHIDLCVNYALKVWFSCHLIM